MFERELLDFSSEVCGENGKRRIELGKHLPAGAAGADDFIRIGGDGDASEFSFSRHDGSANRDPFGTHREPETEVFDVAAGENRAVRTEERRAHGEPGIGSMSALPDLQGGANQ